MTTSSSICTRSIAALVALTLSASISYSQTTATTVPVGFITKTIPAAASAAVPSNTPISVPLYQTADFQSAVAATPAVGAHVVTLTGAAFGANLASPAPPHLLRVKTGARVGKFWLIVNPTTANSVSLKEPNSATGAGVPDADLTGLVVNDSCEILPANTLASVFGVPPPSPGLQGAGSALSADNLLIWNGTNFLTYFFNTNNNSWRSGLALSNDVPLFPDDAVFIVRKGLSAIPVTLLGTVPSTAEQTELLGARNNFIANRFPVDTTLGASGIQNTPGWVKANSAGSADTVLLWDAASGSWFTYFFHQTAAVWRRGLADSTNTVIPAGVGFFVVRFAGTTDAVLTQNLPYTP